MIKIAAASLAGIVLAGTILVAAISGDKDDSQQECSPASTQARIEQVSVPNLTSGDMADRMIAALRAADVPVREVDGWRTRSQGDLPASPGVVWHHDASEPGDSSGVLAWMVSNWDTASAQVWVDRTGTWWLVGAGIAWHAGAVLPGKAGNFQTLGIETDHTIGEDWPEAQLHSLRRGTAALLSLWKRNPADALEFHETIASPVGRKQDPDGLDLAGERAAVAALMPPPAHALRGQQHAFSNLESAVPGAEDGSIVDTPIKEMPTTAGGRTSIAADTCTSADINQSGAFTPRPGGEVAAFDPGNIIADDVFYDTSAMTVTQVRAFIVDQNDGCPTANSWCAGTMSVTLPTTAADEHCREIRSETGDVAVALVTVAVACGINPQVLLTTWKKESGGLTATNPSTQTYAAAFGWACPDTGPGGSANCDPSKSGFAAQLIGVARQFASYRTSVEAGRANYIVGVNEILWNVAESGCGSVAVTIQNTATASLYNYTPYVPNQAALDAYPGTGDDCSTYGNRNFFRLFQTYFGDTGGGLIPAEPGPDVVQAARSAAVGGSTGTSTVGPVAVPYSGVSVAIPDHPDVAQILRGKTIVAPTAQVAAALATGLSWVGTPYSWGGGTPSGPTTGICAAGPASRDCTIVGFDCSGLTEYVAARWGTAIPGTSGPQRDAAVGVPWSQAQPGDILGWPGHVAIFLGRYRGEAWMLESPRSGAMVQVSKVRAGHDDVLYRYWAGS